MIAHTNSSHSGDGGHYLTYCYGDDTWFRFDDNSVKRILSGSESPGQQKMAIDEVQKGGYMIVYTRRDND